MKKIKIAIIDYQMCNLFSVEHAMFFLGAEPIITCDHDKIINADGIILPGVGAFGDAIAILRNMGLDKSIYIILEKKKPFLGICLGFQLLFDNSEEFGSHKGLGIIKGSVKKFPQHIDNITLRIPQIGWNTIQIKKNLSLFEGINQNEYMYFIHSYYAEPLDKEVIATETEYNGFNYCSSVIDDTIFGCQFHPEKSGPLGVKILKNWLNQI